jgi:hypothetical protein
VPAAFGHGPDGACGPLPPPAPAGVGFEVWRRAVATARFAVTSAAALGPTVETLCAMLAGVSLNACSPATTFAGLAGVSDEVDAVGNDAAWSSADRDVGVDDVPA